MSLDESRKRGGVEGHRVMVERISQAAVAKQEEWLSVVAMEIERHCACGGCGHPEILARLERRRVSLL